MGHEQSLWFWATNSKNQLLPLGSCSAGCSASSTNHDSGNQPNSFSVVLTFFESTDPVNKKWNSANKFIMSGKTCLVWWNSGSNKKQWQPLLPVALATIVAWVAFFALLWATLLHKMSVFDNFSAGGGTSTLRHRKLLQSCRKASSSVRKRLFSKYTTLSRPATCLPIKQNNVYLNIWNYYNVSTSDWYHRRGILQNTDFKPV